MEFINPNAEVKVKLCPSCYKEQPLSEFEKVERGRVRVCKLCRTCRNREARETYKKRGRTDRAADNTLQLRNLVMDKDLLNACLYLYSNHGVAIQVKQPIGLSQDLVDYVKLQICPQAKDTSIKLAKVKEDNFIFNIYNSSGKYMRSRSLHIEQLVAYLKLCDYAEKYIK